MSCLVLRPDSAVLRQAQGRARAEPALDGESPIASGPRVIRPSEQVVEYPDSHLIALEFEVATAIVVAPVGIGGH